MKLGNVYQCQRISWPELRKNKAFVKWINERRTEESWGVATWHTGGPLGDYSDLFTWIERGEGSESDMPKAVWNKLIKTVGKDFVGVVWIDFLGD